MTSTKLPLPSVSPAASRAPVPDVGMGLYTSHTGLSPTVPSASESE